MDDSMRKLAAAMVPLLAAATPAAAAPKWNGAGWYQIEDAEVWGWIVNGPYWTEADCKATLPAPYYDEEYGYYSYFYCEHLAAQPEWDK